MKKIVARDYIHCLLHLYVHVLAPLETQTPPRRPLWLSCIATHLTPRAWLPPSMGNWSFHCLAWVYKDIWVVTQKNNNQGCIWTFGCITWLWLCMLISVLSISTVDMLAICHRAHKFHSRWWNFILDLAAITTQNTFPPNLVIHTTVREQLGPRWNSAFLYSSVWSYPIKQKSSRGGVGTCRTLWSSAVVLIWISRNV